MRVAIIPPTGKTGIWTSSRHLIQGLRERDVDVRILHHFALNSAHKRVFLGSYTAMEYRNGFGNGV